MAMVYQDSGEMRSIADDIDTKAAQLDKTASEIFEKMEEKLTADEAAGSAWFGPQAQAFLEEFEKKKPDFENASKNIRSESENLKSQAQAWENFEQRQ